MYTHLRNIGPFSSLTFLIIESLSLYSKLRWLFRFCLFKSQLVILISKRYGTILSQRLPTLPYIFYFLRKKIMEPVLLCVFWIAPQLDHTPKCFIWIFFGDKTVWNKIWLFTTSCFHEEFLEFQSYSKHKNHFLCRFKANLFWKKFKWFLWTGLNKCWKFLFYF
jgi:hypothetical protein